MSEPSLADAGITTFNRRGTALVAPLLLLGLTAPANGQSVAESVATGQLAQSTAASTMEPDIVIERRRLSDKFRIPYELRIQPPPPDRRAAAADLRLACENVGPSGCGTKLVPLVTVGGDGKVVVGSPKNQ